MITPPTDSLYKFISISGVIMLLWGAAFPWDKSYELKLQSIELDGKIKLASKKSQQLQIKYEKLISERKALEKTSDDFEIKKEAIKAQKAKLYIQLLDEVHPTEIDEEKLRVMVEAQNTYNAIGWVSVVAGLIFVFIGFWSWYFRIQRYLDRKIVHAEEERDA